MNLKKNLCAVLWIGVVTITMMAGMMGPGCSKPEPVQEAYRIGCLFAVTGDASWLGEPQRNTVEMIARQINAEGGINGRKLMLIIEDTQGDNTRAVNAAKKLIQKDHVSAIIGTSRSGTSLAVIPVAQEAQIPMLSCAAAANITEPVNERYWIFKMGQNDSDAARRIFGYMKAHEMKTIGIISDTSAFGAAGRTQLKTFAAEYGITIAADETYGPADTDMTAQLIRIKNAGAQALVNWSIGPVQVIVPQNMRQLKMDIPLFQSHGFANMKYVAAAGEAAEGIIFPSGRLMAVDSLPESHIQKSLLAKYKAQYEAEFKDNASTFGGHAYDALWLIINALKSGNDTPAKIRDYIENTKFIGTGGVFAFSATDHCGLDQNAFEMLTVKGGKFVALEQ